LNKKELYGVAVALFMLIIRNMNIF